MISFDQYFFKESSTTQWLEYLRNNQKMEGMAYSGPAAFILEHGKKYESQELTEDEMELLKNVLQTQDRWKMKQCFYNAQCIASSSNDSIKYCEGYADSLGLPMEHAWNTINGKVIDMTWKMNNDNKPVLGVIPDGWEYIGVELPVSLVYDLHDKTGHASPLIADWENGFPLLKKRFKGNVVNELNIQDEEDDEAEFISLYPDNWDKVYPIMRKAVTSKAWASSWSNSFLNAADPKIGGPDEAIKTNPNFKNWTTIHFQSLWDDVWYVYTDQGSLEDNGIRRL